jgi:hypothetical protein
MEYLCLAYYDEQKFDGLSKAEVHAIVSHARPSTRRCATAVA